MGHVLVYYEHEFLSKWDYFSALPPPHLIMAAFKGFQLDGCFRITIKWFIHQLKIDSIFVSFNEAGWAIAIIDLSKINYEIDNDVFFEWECFSRTFFFHPGSDEFMIIVPAETAASKWIVFYTSNEWFLFWNSCDIPTNGIQKKPTKVFQDNRFSFAISLNLIALDSVELLERGLEATIDGQYYLYFTVCAFFATGFVYYTDNFCSFMDLYDHF